MIQTQQTVKAALGEDALLICQLTESKNVAQVTWQKALPDRKNIATYSEKFGPTVNSPFQGKVDFKSPGLQNCSIVIRKVTEQDESCYHCLFNTNPEGALTASTCLRVYEQYEPVLHITRSNSTEESLVSCSATGRPAPAVTLILPEQDLSSSPNNTVSVTNPNGTVTVTATTIVSGFHGNSVQVGCEVQHFSGDVMNVSKPICENKRLIMVERRFRAAIISVVTVAAVILLTVAVILYFLEKQKNRESEKTKTLQTPTKQPQETEVPLFTLENEQIKQPSSPPKTKL